MSQITKEDLNEAVEMLAEKMVETHTISAEVHNDHHEFIADMIQRKKERKDMWKKVREQVYGWAVIGAIGSTLLAIGKYISEHVRIH